VVVGVGKLGNGKREENWRESAANKQNVNGEADESDNIVASDFQLFFIFLRSNKRHSKTDPHTKRRWPRGLPRMPNTVKIVTKIQKLGIKLVAKTKRGD